MLYIAQNISELEDVFLFINIYITQVFNLFADYLFVEV